MPTKTAPLQPERERGAAPGFALRWSVKDSFWNYVTAAGGEIAPGDGAGIDGTAAVFPLVAGTPAHESPLRFHGSVRFTAHHGMLSITVRDPEIHWEGDRGELRVTIGTDTESTLSASLHGAPGDPLTWNAVLVDEGAVLFDFRYPAGTDLAPLTIFRN